MDYQQLPEGCPVHWIGHVWTVVRLKGTWSGVPFYQIKWVRPDKTVSYKEVAVIDFDLNHPITTAWMKTTPNKRQVFLESPRK